MTRQDSIPETMMVANAQMMKIDGRECNCIKWFPVAESMGTGRRGSFRDGMYGHGPAWQVSGGEIYGHGPARKVPVTECMATGRRGKFPVLESTVPTSYVGSRTVGGKEQPFSCFGRLVVFSSFSSVLPHGSGFLFSRDWILQGS